MGKERIALVLGSGAARGWAHFGVLRALDEAGIEPDLVCGCSIGALVGAAWAAQRLDALEEWIRGLDQLDMLQLLDRGLGDGGLINGRTLMAAYAEHIGKGDIHELEREFAAVATDLESGREVWLDKGPIVEVVRASIAVPGMFAPACVDDRWMVDGGLVNPVPVSLARAKGADCVIAVNLNGDLVGNGRIRRRYARPGGGKGNGERSLRERIRGWMELRRRWPVVGNKLFAGSHADERDPPGIISVIVDSIGIMQDRITRARLAGEPPDVLLSPKVGHIGMLEFYRTQEAIEIGYECARSQMDEIRDRLR